MSLSAEVRWRPTYSSRVCLYAVLVDGETIVESCPHTHSTRQLAEKCATRMLEAHEQSA